MEPISIPPDWDATTEPSAQQRYFVAPHTTAASAGTVRVYLGLADERGLTLRRIWAIPADALAVHATAYNTFRPFVSTVKNGTAAIRYIGAGRGTNSFALVAGVPYRTHDTETLNEDLPVGSLFGVDVVTTGSPDAKRILFQASTIRGRR